MKRLFCAALLCAFLLTGCGAAAPETRAAPESPDNPSGPAVIVATPEDTGEAVAYRWGDAVSIRMTLPEGWAWEEAPQDEGMPPASAGVVFYPRGRDGDCPISFCCWLQGFGMCGTGVTFSEVAGVTGETATLALEESGDHIFVTIIRQNVPGSYVASGYLPLDFWQANQDAILTCVLDARLGEDCMTLDEARSLARDVWPETEMALQQLAVYGRYDVLAREWTLTLTDVKLRGDMPHNTPLYTLTVNHDGTVGQVQPVQWNSGK